MGTPGPSLPWRGSEGPSHDIFPAKTASDRSFSTVDECSGMPHPERPHHVYMCFFLLEGWQVQFLSPDLKTAALPSRLTLTGPERLRELAKQGDVLRTPEARQRFERAIQTGSGGVHLKLTRGQFSKLTEC
jgi:hypothetical protein